MKNRLILSVLLFLAVLAIGEAQQIPDAPLPAAFSGYVKHKNKFYVYGGMSASSGTNNSFAATGQFYALDLSKPWKSESPAWIRLPEGPKENITSIAISTDGKVMVSFPAYSDTMRRYNFDSRTWGVALSGGAWFHGHGLLIHPITVPTDGNVLLVQSSNVAGVPEMVNQYSFSEDKVITGKPLDPWNPFNGSNYLPAREAYQAAWSSSINSTVIYGGNSTKTTDQWVSIYDPLTNMWRLLPTTGNPEMTSHHCGAISDDGKTFFSYGGRGGSNDLFYRSSLFILDLPTRKWTQGADSKRALIGASCTVAGDYFLLWGGANYDSIIDANKTSTPVRIYQISQNKWIEDYLPSGDYLEPVTATLSPTSGPSATSGPGAPPGSGSRNPSSNGSGNISTGAIAGGAAAGAVVVIALIGFLVWRRKRRGEKHIRHYNSSESKNDLYKPRHTGGPDHSLVVIKDIKSGPHQHVLNRPQPTPSPTIARSPRDALASYGYTGNHELDGRRSGSSDSGTYDILYIPSPSPGSREVLSATTANSVGSISDNDTHVVGGSRQNASFPSIGGSAPPNLSAQPSVTRSRYPHEAFPHVQLRGHEQSSSDWQKAECSQEPERVRTNRRPVPVPGR